MKNINKKFNKRDKFASYNGIELLEVENCYAVDRIKLTENHLNGEKIAHGGTIFTLAAATNIYGQITLSINASINYYQPGKGEVLIANAKEISSSRKLTHYNVDIFDENKILIDKININVYKKEGKISLNN